MVEGIQGEIENIKRYYQNKKEEIVEEDEKKVESLLKEID